MVPWDKLPDDAQKAVLTMIIIFGGTSASCRLGQATTPMICDPAPPPSMTPSPTAEPTPTPMIFGDLPPPPSGTPMICDPAPPPPLVTVAPGQHFTVRSVQIVPDEGLEGVAIRGTITDQDGQPLGGLTITLEHDDSQVEVASDQMGMFAYVAPEAGVYVLAVQGDETSPLRLELKPQDVATIEWVETWEGSHVPLPLAEIRTVDIVWQDILPGDSGLTFVAETPWTGARYRWSASGGTLNESGEGVVWQAPPEPGRYLLQVVADWGRTGLAVDSLVLIVEDESSVVSSQ
jgi:hypothetical protein